jgi:hypothetical protein
MGTSNPNVQATDFRIEEELPNGTVHVLQSRIANPGDYGMKPFSISLSTNADRKLILRSAAATNAEANSPNRSETEKPAPLSCWADIRLK